MTSSFINHYAKRLHPDFDRKPEDGDYYGSPLQCLGVPFDAASLIQTRWLYNSEQKQPTTLYSSSITRDLHTADAIGFERHSDMIIYHEALLRSVSGCKDSLNPDFFRGVENYFNPESSNAHKTSESIYQIILQQSLAAYSAVLHYHDLQLPETTALNNTSAFDCALKHDILRIYAQLFSVLQENAVLTAYLQRLYENINKGISKHPVATCFRKSRLLDSECDAAWILLDQQTIHLSFQTEPWNTLLHKVKKLDNLDFNHPQNHFPFSKKHPSRSLLWMSLLLLELEQCYCHQITDLPNTTPSVMNPSHDCPSNDQHTTLQHYIRSMTTDAHNPQTRTSKALRDDFEYLKAGQGKRYAQSTTSDTAKTQSAYMTLDFGDALQLNHTASGWQLSICIAESTLDDITQTEFAMLQFYVDCYHGNKVTQIPCELLEETGASISDRNYTRYTLGLDGLALQALDVEDALDELPCLAGVSGRKASADIVVIFCLSLR